MNEGPYDYPARTICDVLQEMRSLDKRKYYVPIGGLIEELQILANRMEAHLDTSKTYFEFRDAIGEAKKELKQLRNETKLLTDLKDLTKEKS